MGEAVGHQRHAAQDHVAADDPAEDPDERRGERAGAHELRLERLDQEVHAAQPAPWWWWATSTTSSPTRTTCPAKVSASTCSVQVSAARPEGDEAAVETEDEVVVARGALEIVGGDDDRPALIAPLAQQRSRTAA